jgi:hypothetical protein
MHGNGLVLAFGVVALMVAQSVQATATLTSDDRYIEIEADVTIDGVNSHVGPLSDMPAMGELFDTSMTDGVPAGALPAAEADAFASQTSSFDASPVFTSIMAEGAANAHGQINSFTEITDFSSSAESVFSIVFNVATAQDWSISASILDEGSGSTARVRLRHLGGADVFLLQNTTGSDSGSGTLDPGDYELLGEAKAIFFGSSTGTSFYDKDANFSFDFSIVPEPASGLLLLIGGSLLLRRRATRTVGR